MNAAGVAQHPDYIATASLDVLRATDYARLDAQQHVYLDYTGAGLFGESQLRGRDGRLDPFQPALTEVGVDLSGAEPATGAALSGTESTLELDAIAPELEHLA